MARVPRVIPNQSVSAFSQGSVPRVNGFTALGEVLQYANEKLQPALKEGFRQKGANSVYRDETGTLRVDEMNLLGGEMAVIHNAAAYSSYLAKTGIDARDSVSELATRFENDPAGFKEAANLYKSNALKSAPAALTADVDEMLSTEISNVGNGLTIRKIRSDRSDADQSLSLQRDLKAGDAIAIIDQYGPDSPEALAAMDAAINIENLRVGFGFSVPEAGAVLREDMLAKGAAKRDARLKTQSKDVIDAARAGLTHELEAETLADSAGTPLEGPLRVAIAAREVAPEFSRLPPEAQQQFITEYRSLPATEGSDQVVKELESISKDTKAAIAKDPIGYAKDRHGSMVQPVSLTDATSLAVRLQSATALYDLGVNPEGKFFDDQEAKTFRVQFTNMSPAEKLTAVSSMVAGLGDQGAVRAIGEIGGSKVSVHASRLLATGADPEIGLRMFAGEAADKAVPIKSEVRAQAEQEFIAELSAALDPAVAADLAPEVLSAAGAYYQGAGLPDGIDEGEQETAYKTALNAALGGYNGRGGVQDVNGRPTLLPPQISGLEASSAFDTAFGLISSSADANIARKITRNTGRAVPEVLSEVQGRAMEQFRSIMAQASADGQGIPMAGGEMLEPEDVGGLRLNAIGNDRYEVVYGDPPVALSNSVTGETYILSLTRLVDATR